MQERNCLKNCYFNTTSFFAKLLSSRIFVTIFYFILSIFLTITILYTVLDYSIWMQGYLVVHIALSISIYFMTKRVLKNTLKETYLNLLSREITINLAAIIFFIVFLYYSLYTYEPTYLADTLLETMHNATNRLTSHCVIVDYVVRLKSEIDAIAWFLIQKSDTIFGDDVKSIHQIALGVFVFVNALSVVGLNRFILQVIYLLEKVFEKKRDDATE